MSLTNIRQLRKSAGLTQAELAVKVGVTKAAVSSWESGGTKDLKMQHLFDVARALNVEAESLVKEPSDKENLTAEEKEILQIFRRIKNHTINLAEAYQGGKQLSPM